MSRLLQSFKLKDDELKKYELVKRKYFVRRHNVLYERAKFNRHSQGENETTVMDLYRF